MSASHNNARYGSLPKNLGAGFLGQRRSISIHPGAPMDIYQSHNAYGRLNQDVSPEVSALQARVTELEHRVASQDSELMLLRTSTSDILRRLSTLEAERSQNVAQDRTHYMSRSMTQSPLSRTIRRDELHSNASVTSSPSRMSYSMYGQTEPQLEDMATLKPSSSSFVNVPVGKSPRGSPMRKWMSSYDVKEQKTFNNQMPPMSPRPPSRRSSQTTLNSSTSNLSSINSLTLNVPSYRSTISRSPSSRLGSMHSLHSLAASSRFSSSRRSLANQEPEYDSETKILTVQVNNRSIQVPVPSTAEFIDFDSEQAPPKGRAPEIDWVYGFRGKDVRNHILHIPTGEIVYMSGSIVILYNREEHTQRHYTQHTSDITCMDLHPKRILIASAQSSRHTKGRSHPHHVSPVTSPQQMENVLENDQTQAHIRIWDSVTLSTLCVLGVLDNSFEKSISCLAFSTTDSGTYLACVDEGFHHCLSVWQWEKRTKVAEAKSSNDISFSIAFHSTTPNRIVQYGKGHFNFWTFNPHNATLNKTMAVFDGREKPKYILAATPTEDQRVVSGDSNGTISLWDMETGKLLKSAHGVHPGGVFAVATNSMGHILSGGKDKRVIEWESTDFVRVAGPAQLPDDAGIVRSIVGTSGSGLLIGTSQNQIIAGDMKMGFKYLIQADSEDISSVCVHPHVPKFISASVDGQLKMYDLETNAALWNKNTEVGITQIGFSPCGSIIGAGTSAGKVLLIDSSTRNTVHEVKVSEQPISALEFAPTGGLVLVAAKDNTTIIYKLDSTRKLAQTARITGLLSPVVKVDWSADGEHIRINTEAPSLAYYNKRGEAVNGPEMRDVNWNSVKCGLSFESALALHSSPHTTDTCCNKTKDLLIAGQLDGSLRLYSAPVQSVTAGFHEMRAHTSRVSRVVFANERHFVTVAENNLIKWRLGD